MEFVCAGVGPRYTEIRKIIFEFSLKMVALIYFIVSEINILIKFR